LFTGGVDDAPGQGYFNLILGDNGAAGSRSWARHSTPPTTTPLSGLWR
jgi:hypothetical protein